MDRTHANDVEVSIGTKSDAVLVCAADPTFKMDLASVLRQDYPVRTAESEADAVASIDESVTVLVLDDTDREFSLERLLEVRDERDCRFQLAAIVSQPATRWLRGRCDGFVRKPVDDQELRSTVRRLHRRGRYDKTLGTFYALSERYADLAADPNADPEELRSLEEQLAQVRTELDAVGDTLADADAFEVALGDVDDPDA